MEEWEEKKKLNLKKKKKLNIFLVRPIEKEPKNLKGLFFIFWKRF